MYDKAIKLTVSLSDQVLDVFAGDDLRKRYSVSTSMFGPGEQRDSQCTPRGEHYIRAKIGAGAPLNAVFTGRRQTGEVYSQALGAQAPDRDWVLSRILWLCGLEPGKNRLGQVDSMARYIYIHGTPDSEPLGVPRSHGCIRMSNTDVVELFEQVSPGTPVDIQD
ncbi:MAG: L,D-transpeptidase family protein [Gammaproteobacteria bacterium]